MTMTGFMHPAPSPPPAAPQVTAKLSEQLTDIVTDAVLAVRREDQPIDLYMVRTCVRTYVSERDAARSAPRLAWHEARVLGPRCSVVVVGVWPPRACLWRADVLHGTQAAG